MTASADMYKKNYIFPIENKFLNQSPCLGMQSQIAITKQKIIEKCLISDYPKIQTFIHAKGRPIDHLPSKILICSDHFEETCFDPSWKLQNELYCKDRQVSRRLPPGSIPTLMTHKKDIKPRLSSEKRALAQKEEVIFCFNKVVTGPQTTALLKKRSLS